MPEGTPKDDLPPISKSQRLDFVEALIRKQSMVRRLREQGKNVRAADEAVDQQIHDTITTGDPKKA